jgi:hypothetical protein
LTNVDSSGLEKTSYMKGEVFGSGKKAYKISDQKLFALTLIF